jgi:aspartyl-tRNA(Asn)/glutamyl-tRNA(Gln) amidotransferase subunit A
MCGVFGLKPTTGRLSIRGMLPLAPSMDTPGPLAATAGDLAVLYRIMSGVRVDPGATDGGGPVRLVRPGGPFERVHPVVADWVERAAGVFAAAGATVQPSAGPTEPDLAEGLRGIWHRLTDREFLRAHPGPAARRHLVHPEVAVHFEHAERLTDEQVEEAERRRGEVGRWFRQQFEGADALLIPTTPYAAPLAEQSEVDMGPAGLVEIARVGPGWLTSLVNLAGLPAIDFPAGRTPEGLPVGATLVGRDDGEETLLRLAALWERESGYRPERPEVPAITI